MNGEKRRKEKKWDYNFIHLFCIKKQVFFKKNLQVFIQIKIFSSKQCDCVFGSNKIFSFSLMDKYLMSN